MSTTDTYHRGIRLKGSKETSRLLSSAIKRRCRWSLLALPLCFLAGCVDRSTDGKTSIYTFSLWILVVAVLGGLAIVTIGFVTRKKEPRWRAYVLVVLGVLVIAIMVPMMRSDRVEVDEEHFTSTHGLPWDRARHDVRFDQLREIRVEVTETKSRTGGTKKNYALLCQSKSGGVEKVPVGNVMEGAVGQVLGIARQKGVPVVGVEQLPEAMRPQ
jgi:hypothetical protein